MTEITDESLRTRGRLIEADLTIGGGLNARLFALFEAIDREGSIVNAARSNGLSYKGAWQMIERINRLAPRPLIESVLGGGHVKGTRLTPTGTALLEAFRGIQNEKEAFLERLNRDFGQEPDILVWFRRLFMKSSARNQWMGKVKSVTVGAVTSEVSVLLEGGSTLVATVSNESAKVMDLSFDRDVLALVKASMIILVTDLEGYQLSARNQFSGRVSRLKEGLVTTDVTLKLDSGGEVVANITFESAESLGLKIGTSATAIFKAGSVVLGVPE